MAEFQALLRAKAEWKPHQIAKAEDISALAESAKSLAETVKSTLSLASAAMEIVKLLAMLQQINPLLIALEALADEVLKAIQDLKVQQIVHQEKKLMEKRVRNFGFGYN